MSVGAIVVNHNAGASLSECVASLMVAQVDEIVVVDNSSSDFSLDLLEQAFSGVHVIRTGKNLGYGTAVNIGRNALSSDYLFICNPDLVVDERAPGYLVSGLLADAQVAIVGPQILELDGTVYPSARRFPSVIDAFGHALFAMFWPNNPFTRRYKLEAVNLTSVSVCDWVSGACMMARATAFDVVQGFDERYFMYVEDLDLCWRLSRASWKIAYEPRAGVIHQGGLSSGRHPYRMLVAHHVSTWRFVRRSMTGPKRLLLPVVAIGIATRLLVALGRKFVLR